jgi:hypothetical protein
MDIRSLPRLERSADHARLIVDDEAFLCIGGELHNSSSSDRRYMAPLWEKIAATNANSVIATVAWDQVEPPPKPVGRRISATGILSLTRCSWHALLRAM